MSKQPAISVSSLNLLLADWKTLRELIQEVIRTSRVTYHGGESTDVIYTALSDTEWRDLTQGPFHTFFTPTLKAHTLISRLQSILNTHKSDWAKATQALLPEYPTFPPDAADKLQNAVLEKLLKELGTLSKTQFEAWKTFHKTQTEGATVLFTQTWGALSESEQRELMQCEPLSELEILCAERQITPPHAKDFPLSFEAYYELKWTLLLQGILARLHQAHDEKTLSKAFKPFKPLLNTLSKTATHLATEQKKALTNLLAPIITLLPKGFWNL
ncbi:MAG: hypothetical protein A3J38_10240 [Gammaproteobacteria bacterium RIFCSPHIGHO2_12_FULL_45_9]|nr:MAG: hypothetical protein A3J38_10240 [Gammaproteobacteria bacterium RIFCSPHIGHO2_12_FULL_45_9]